MKTRTYDEWITYYENATREQILEDVKEDNDYIDILQQRTEKAIDLVERLIKEYKINYGDEPSKILLTYEKLLEILQGK